MIAISKKSGATSPKKLRKKIIALVFTCFAIHGALFGQVVYVDSSKASSGNGSSWATAYKTFAEAMQATQNNPNITAVNVAKGTYYTRGDLKPDTAFTIYRGNLKIYGGFAPGGGNRNPAANPVVLSAKNPTRRSVFVMVIAGISTATDSIVLDGLQLKDGRADNGMWQTVFHGEYLRNSCGGGLAVINVNRSCKVALKNCQLVNDTANTGAAIYAQDADAVSVDGSNISDNYIISDLTAGKYTHAVLAGFSSGITISNSVFSHNSGGSGDGVAISNDHDSMSVTNTIFSDNHGQANGTCINNSNSTVCNISYCNFLNNTAGSGYYEFGDAIYNISSVLKLRHSNFTNNGPSTTTVAILNSPDAVVDGCVFSENQVLSIQPEGILSITNSNPTITNCLFTHNTGVRGGAISTEGGSTPIVSNCTFYKNNAITWASFGGAVYCDATSGGTYKNCIFWKDTVFAQYDSNRYEFYSLNTGTDPSRPAPAIAYSIITSPFPILNVIDGGHNSSIDPLFVDKSSLAGPDSLFGTIDDGLRLLPCSPAVDAGTNSAVINSVTDLKSETRIVNGSVDLGAYEYSGAELSIGMLIANDGDSSTQMLADTSVFIKDCRLISTIVAKGADPVIGTISAKVSISTSFPNETIPYVERIYEFSPAEDLTGSMADIILYYTQPEFERYNDKKGSLPPLPLNPADLESYKKNAIIKYVENGSTDTISILPNSFSWDSSHNWWAVTFSTIGTGRYLLSTQQSALPILLTYFDGSLLGKTVQLGWKADCGTDDPGLFELQRSYDGSKFETIYTIQLNENQCRNSVSYLDEKPGMTFNYYRLKIKEKNGRITYSSIKIFNLSGKVDFFVYPSIITRGESIQVNLTRNNCTMQIISNNGLLISKVTLSAGRNDINITAAAGVYFYKILNHEMELQRTGKFIVR